MKKPYKGYSFEIVKDKVIPGLKYIVARNDDGDVLNYGCYEDSDIEDGYQDIKRFIDREQS